MANERYKLHVKSNMYVNGVKLTSDDDVIIPAGSLILMANHDKPTWPLNLGRLLGIKNSKTTTHGIYSQDITFAEDLVRIHNPLLRDGRYLPHMEPFVSSISHEGNIISAKKLRKIWIEEYNIRKGLLDRFGDAGEFYNRIIFGK